MDDHCHIGKDEDGDSRKDEKEEADSLTDEVAESLKDDKEEEAYLNDTDEDEANLKDTAEAEDNVDSDQEHSDDERKQRDGDNVEQAKDEHGMCEDVDDDDIDFPPSVPQKFTIDIPHEEWKAFHITKNSRGDRRLTGNWTEVFAKEISKKNPSCPITFKWNHIIKANSRKKHCPFFSAKASCKFGGCLTYTLKVKREPKEGKDVKVKIKCVKPFTKIKHDCGVTKGRPIKGKKRKEFAEEIEKSGPSNAFYDKLGNITREAFEAGNTTDCGTKDVLQKISSESNVGSRFHKDVVIEVIVAKEMYEYEDESEGELKGIIQSISLFPFSVSLYNNDQMDILAENIRKRTAVLYFDATGKVIQTIPDQPKRVLYYPLLLKGKEKGDPPVPVAELISNSHNTVDISSFLMKLNRDLHQCYPTVGIPQRIEIDFSWVFIHSIVLSFNHEDIAAYLDRAWDVIHRRCDWGSHTKVHICSAHLLHKISGRLSQFVKNKDCRRYIMYVIARMVDAETLEQIDTYFKSLCTLLLSERLDSHPQLQNSIDFLDKVVSRESPESHVHAEDADRGDDENEADKSTGTQLNTLIFGNHFRRISQEVTDEMVNGSSERNPYHSSDMVTYLINTYMKIVPLWTGLLLDGTHDTNSPAENFMKIVKKDILNDQTRLTPRKFINKVRKNLKGRIREYKRRTQANKNLHQSTKKRKKVSTASFASSEEKWGGKKKKKGIYFSSPSKLPKPKQTLFSKKKQPKSNTKGERGLPWGGKIQFGARIIHLSNTCPVDNLLMVMFYLFKRPSIRTWFEDLKDELDVCQVLLDINSFFQSGNWVEGRALWLQRFIKIPTTDVWDTWGSEVDMFVAHFGQVQETEVKSSCSRRKCPRKEKCLKSREILLGYVRDAENAADSCGLEESLRQWEEETATPPCAVETGHGPCKGLRTSTQRTFVQSNPPVLIMSVSFLSQSRGLVPNALPDTVTILEKRYDLFAYTVCTGGHFKAYLHMDDTWHEYNGLNRPEVTVVEGGRDDGILEHVVYTLTD